MRVAIYARVSKEEQVEGFSIDAQLRAMRDFTTVKGWQIYKEYIDDGYSARTDVRPRFQELIKDAKARTFDYILVHKFDRFARNREHAVTYKALLKKIGVFVLSVSEPTDPNSVNSIIFEGMMEVIAEWYSANLAQEIKKGKIERARQGLHQNTPPFGYEKDDDVAKINEHDKEAVRLAFQEYATGRYTYMQIAELLNSDQRGFHSHTRSGPRPFTKHMIDEMLRNRFYIGEVEHGNYAYLWDDVSRKIKRVRKSVDYFQGKHQALITRDVFDTCQVVRDKYPHGYNQPQEKFSYLCSGLLICVECGTRLNCHSSHGSDKKVRCYYMPRCHVGGKKCSKSQKHMRNDLIDNQVGAIIASLRLPSDWQQAVIELAKGDSNYHEVIRQRQQFEERLRRLNKMYLRGDEELTDDEYERRKRELRAKLASLQIPEEGAMLSAGVCLEHMYDYWHKATTNEQKEMLRSAVEAIRVDPDQKQIVAIKAKSAFIPLFDQCEALLGQTNGWFSLTCGLSRK